MTKHLYYLNAVIMETLEFIKSLAKIFILLCLLIISAFAQSPRKLPDPIDPTNNPSPFGIPPKPSDYNSSLETPNPSVARNIAEQAVSGLDSLTNRIQQNQSMIENLQSQIVKLDDDISRMRREKQQVLAELRGGFYCSQCNRSKTEIEQGGENFEQHLVKVNGVKLSASQNIIDAKAQEYDQKFAELEAKAERERPKLKNAIEQYKSENQNAWGQIQEGVDLWRVAVSLEQNLIVAREAEIRKRELNEIKVAAEKIKELEKGDRIGSPDAMSKINDEIAMWKKIKGQAEANAEKRYSSYWQDINASNKIRNQEYSKISSFLPRTSEFSGYMLSNHYSYLPAVSVSTERITNMPLSLKYDNGKLGMSFKLGSIASADLQGGSTSYMSTEVTAVLSLFSTVKIGVSWQTDYTIDGVVSVPTPILEITQPKDKKNLKVPIIEEKPKRILPKP